MTKWAFFIINNEVRRVCGKKVGLQQENNKIWANPYTKEEKEKVYMNLNVQD